MPQKTATFEKMTGKTASNAFKGLDVCPKNAQRRPMLSPRQIALVATVFWFTSIGAVLLAWGFARWNGR